MQLRLLLALLRLLCCPARCQHPFSACISATCAPAPHCQRSPCLSASVLVPALPLLCSSLSAPPTGEPSSSCFFDAARQRLLLLPTATASTSVALAFLYSAEQRASPGLLSPSFLLPCYAVSSTHTQCCAATVPINVAARTPGRPMPHPQGRKGASTACRFYYLRWRVSCAVKRQDRERQRAARHVARFHAQQRRSASARRSAGPRLAEDRQVEPRRSGPLEEPAARLAR